MCYSNDVTKKGDYFICACCGTRYSDEDTKRLLIDGTVDVSGSVKVDHSGTVKLEHGGTVKIDNRIESEKFLKLARFARDKEDWQDMEKYYSLVMLHDPNNPEAIFYNSIGKARVALWDDNFLRRKAVFNALCKSMILLKKHVNIDSRTLFEKMSESIEAMRTCEFAAAAVKAKDGNQTDGRAETKELFAQVNSAFIELLRSVWYKCGQNNKSAVYLAELIAIHYGIQAKFASAGYRRNSYLQSSYEYYSTVKRVAPNYKTYEIKACIQRLRKTLMMDKHLPAIKEWLPMILLAAFLIVIIVLSLIFPSAFTDIN